ncbi:MAG: hypothetical protein JJT94_02530 [Bernardetiaceae bacterium]|nr:hypothetical protein [Bernardetiaceae bacterium]
MQPQKDSNPVLEELRAYKRKHYKNQIIKGSLLAVSTFLTAFALVNMLEYFGNFNSALRAVLFYGFLSVSAFSLLYWVLRPAYHLLDEKKQISNSEAAKRIGSFFPEVSDRLLNILQLQELAQSHQSDLVRAGLNQKTSQISHVRFTQAIDYKKNRKYLRFLIFPLIGIGLLALIIPNLFVESTTRLIRYNESFEPTMPFSFAIQNSEMTAFKNEDFNLRLSLEGESIPAEIFLFTENGRRIKLLKNDEGLFAYDFKNVQRDFKFSFEAAGFHSSEKKVSVLERPNLSNFNIYLSYPAYTGKKDERLENTGNLTVPAGTKVLWNLKTRETESMQISLQEPETIIIEAKNAGDGLFEAEKRAMQSTPYEIKLTNKYSDNKEKIAYFMQVIPDAHPKVTLSQMQDSVLYDYVVVGGTASDDYGISKLQLKYRIFKEGNKDKNPQYKTVALPHNKAAINQQYFHQLDVKELNLQPGDKLEYFVEVWDNDGVNGSKSSRTGMYAFEVPSKKALREEVKQSSENTEKQIDKAHEEAKDLQSEIQKMQDKLKGKKELTWEDKKQLEELLKKHEKLKKEIENMQSENKNLNKKQERFSEEEKRIAEKAEQLQKLMDDLLDDEMKALYEKLNELLDENAPPEDIQEILDKLQKKEDNLEKELDRALEMFKQLQFDKKLEDLAKQLEELAQKQEQLAEENKDAKDDKNKAKDDKNDKGKDEDSKEQEAKQDDSNAKEADQENQESDSSKDQKQDNKSDENSTDSQDAKEKQEELNKEFEDIKEQLEELDKMNEDMKKPRDMDDMKEKQEDIEQDMQDASEQMEQNQPQKASESQQKAGEKMKQMAMQMQQMMQSAQMEQMMEDYNTLRQILENLLTLSFDQEDVMRGFREVKQRDPRFIDLSQKQLKLADDAKIVEDSLRALASRVFQLEAFVMRELTDMNDYMGQATFQIKERRPDIAASKQQRAMTSMNNLALMLDDVMDQMQQQMGMAMPGQQMSNMPKGKPNLGQMQQSLNEQISELKKSGKSGRKMSEDLAKIAAQQEMIRRALEKAGKDKGNKDGGKEGDGGSYGDLIKEMEKTEEDLVNKRLTQELIERQQQILTRLLESEKAERERELDKEREAEQVKDQKRRKAPSEFSEYFKLKERQVELLKTIPPALSPYYKQKVNEYFEKLDEL